MLIFLIPVFLLLLEFILICKQISFTSKILIPLIFRFKEVAMASVVAFVPPLNRFRRPEESGYAPGVESVQQSGPLNVLVESMKISDARQEKIFTLNKDIYSKCIMLSVKLRTCSDLSECKGLIDNIREEITTSTFFTPPTVFTEVNSFSVAIEKFTTCRLYCNFLETGKLLMLDEVQPCTDEEYLGSCISFGHELLEYCVGRAAEVDITTIKYCHKLVTQLSDALNQFEFRNSPLRRKYDSLKYIVKKLTDMIYELGLAIDLNVCRQIAFEDGVDRESSSSPKKRAKIDDTFDGSMPEMELVPMAPLEAIRGRLDAFDKQREELIKATRDVQKLAKQGIYAVHREIGKPVVSFLEADRKFKAAQDILTDLFDKIVRRNPSLRQASFSAAIEELLEGLLLMHWCQHRKLLSKTDCEDHVNAGIVSAGAPGTENKNVTIDSSLAGAVSVSRLVLTDGEYFGALSDLTGELGRIAVFQAMKRDVKCVVDILSMDTDVAELLVRVNTGGRLNKKVDAVLNNRKKVMELQYDMACLALSGGVRGSTVSASVDGSELKDSNSNSHDEE